MTNYIDQAKEIAGKMTVLKNEMVRLKMAAVIDRVKTIPEFVEGTHDYDVHTGVSTLLDTFTFGTLTSLSRILSPEILVNDDEDEDDDVDVDKLIVNITGRFRSASDEDGEMDEEDADAEDEEEDEEDADEDYEDDEDLDSPITSSFTPMYVIDVQCDDEYTEFNESVLETIRSSNNAVFASPETRRHVEIITCANDIVSELENIGLLPITGDDTFAQINEFVANVDAEDGEGAGYSLLSFALRDIEEADDYLEAFEALREYKLFCLYNVTEKSELYDVKYALVHSSVAAQRALVETLYPNHTIV